MMKLTQIFTTGAIALILFAGSSLAGGRGATQISGVAFLDFGENCDLEGEGASAAFAMHMADGDGDLIGCLYVYPEGSVCSPSGTYREWGTEMFVGWYDRNGDGVYEADEWGSFETTYLFTAKLKDCDLEQEIFGRCQHPIEADTGTGVFEGVTGRIDIKDDVETGELNYRGHQRW